MDLLERIDAIQGIDAASSSTPQDLVDDGEEDTSYEAIEVRAAVCLVSSGAKRAVALPDGRVRGDASSKAARC